MEELQKSLNELKSILDGKVKALEDAQKNGVSNETIKGLEATINSLNEAVEAQKTRIEELETSGKSVVDAKPKSMIDGLKALDLKGMATNRDAHFTIEAKDANTIMVSGATPIADAASLPYVVTTEVVPGIQPPTRSAVSILMQYADTRPTSTELVVWVNKVNAQGNAAFVAEGELKPLRSFELKKENSVAKKVAVSFKVSTESLSDVIGLQAMINADGISEVDRETGIGLMNGDGVDENLNGVTKYAAKYNLTTIKAQSPDYFGAVRAAIAQVQSLGFTPNVGFINPIDAANMDLTKGSNGQYVLPPFTTSDGTTIAGITLVPTPEIAAGNLLIGDFTKFHIRPYGGKTIDMGTENDDFRRNLRTIIVEQRLHAYMYASDAGAILFDTFANIVTAITAAPVAG